MAEARVERRLAAIFAGDIAGYSRLMGADEEGTLSRLNAHRREFLEPKVAEHRGRIVKRTGDGVLIEFASAVDAARCAVEIQHGMIERNAPVPQDKRIELRIGIHVGDVMIEDGDIFGDGVNIAARRCWFGLSPTTHPARSRTSIIHQCLKTEHVRISCPQFRITRHPEHGCQQLLRRRTQAHVCF
jgi:Adenylate and Guanylate cyclase catalytic domain